MIEFVRWLIFIKIVSQVVIKKIVKGLKKIVIKKVVIKNFVIKKIIIKKIVTTQKVSSTTN